VVDDTTWCTCTSRKGRAALGRSGYWSLEAAWRLVATTSTWTSEQEIYTAQTKFVLPGCEKCQVCSYKLVRLRGHLFITLVSVSEC